MESTNRHAIRQAAALPEDPGGSANTSPQEYCPHWYWPFP